MCPVNLTACLFVTSLEQRSEGQSVSSRGLPEVHQRGPGNPAGGSHTGAGGKAGGGGKVRQVLRLGIEMRCSKVKVMEEESFRGKVD